MTKTNRWCLISGAFESHPESCQWIGKLKFGVSRGLWVYHLRKIAPNVPWWRAVRRRFEVEIGQLQSNYCLIAFVKAAWNWVTREEHLTSARDEVITLKWRLVLKLSDLIAWSVDGYRERSERREGLWWDVDSSSLEVEDARKVGFFFPLVHFMTRLSVSRDVALAEMQIYIFFFF